MNLARYRKFIIAALGAVAIGLQQIAGVGDGQTLFGLPVDTIVNTVIAIATAIGVRQVPNKPAA